VLLLFWFAFGLLFFFVYHPTETMAKKPGSGKEKEKRDSDSGSRS